VNEAVAQEVDPDALLMVRVQEGDRASFEKLFLKYSRQIVAFVRRFVGNQALAEELAQDVFLKAYRSRDDYEPRAKFTTYLYRIATNHCLNELRRGVHRNVHDPLDAPKSASERAPRAELADPAPGPDAIAAGRSLAAAVDAAIASLPEAQRAALLLLRYEGQSYEEIASALSMSVPAVKSLLNRAKTSLRERLAPYLREERHELHQD